MRIERIKIGRWIDISESNGAKVRLDIQTEERQQRHVTLIISRWIYKVTADPDLRACSDARVEK